jgi:hypothetical protein
MILVSLLNPKFAIALAAMLCELRVRGTSVAADLGRCFQLMETDDVSLFQRWIASWADLTEFEVVPVVPGAKTAEALGGQLDG